MSTRSHHELPAGACWALLAALLLLAPAPVTAQGVHIALVPPLQNVAPGAGVDLELDATAAGSVFNGFTVIVGYDPGALTFVPKSPIGLQEGCLMTGTCSVACGRTFHDFLAVGDSLSITDILLCNGILLPGPGQLYKLHFTASTTPQVTTVRIRSAEFYAGGTYVTPVETQDAIIGIGVVVDVPNGPKPGGALRLSVAPNPARGSASIRVENSAGGDEELLVSDIAGRAVRQLQRGAFPPGARSVMWDGRDDRGKTMPAGVYLVRLCSGGRVFNTRLTLLQ